MLCTMLLPLCLALSAHEEIDLYIGTYTTWAAGAGSKGIYRARLDVQTGAISVPELVAEGTNPSFLAVEKNRLYAVQEGAGLTSAYLVEETKLHPLGEAHAEGCHILVDPRNRFVLTADYGGGVLALLPIRPNGSLDHASAPFKNAGHGPLKGRQEGPHMHAAYVHPNGRNIYACDLGTDEVLGFRFDPKGGLGEPRRTKLAPGAGPRHLAIRPDGRSLYVVNELNSTVTGFKIDRRDGSLKEFQTVSTLGEGEGHQGNFPAEIAFHPNGRWLYASNRGHDSIAVYAIGRDGRIRLLEVRKAGVQQPRSFAIDPGGRWLVVAGQKSNDLAALEILADGTLKPAKQTMHVPAPTCVVFATR